MFTKIRGICQLSQFLDEIQKDFANPPNSEVNFGGAGNSACPELKN